MLRGRRSVTLDLKSAERRRGGAAPGRARRRDHRRLSPRRDGAARPRPRGDARAQSALVYGRMTGWGQDGPLAARAGHDINYIALAGVLHAIGRAGEAPVPPLNLVGDFGGGGMLLAFGIACGVIEARRERPRPGRRRGDGRRRGAAGDDVLRHARRRQLERASAASTSSTPARPGTTPTRRATASYVAIGAIEPKFYAELLAAARPRPATLPRRSTTAPAGRRCARASPRPSRSRTRDEWCSRLRRLRRLLRAGALVRRIAPPSARRGARRRDRASAASPSRRRRRASIGRRARRARPPPERGEGGAAALARLGLRRRGDRGSARLGVGCT